MRAMSSLLLAMVFAGTAVMAADIKYYVAVNGDDKASGTEAQPFKTLTAARDKVRADIAGGLTGNITVYVRRGTYLLGGTVTFDEKDGGSGAWTVSYEAYPGEKPILSGGRFVTGWTKVSGSVYSTVIPEVKSGASWFRNLWCNKSRCTLKNPETLNVWSYTMARWGATYEATAALATEPGDWALDKNSGTLFYNAGADEVSKQTFVAGNLEKIIVISGPDTDKKIHNFRLAGLYLMHTDWEYGPSGYNEGWAGSYKVGDGTVNEIPTAVEVAFADNVVVENVHVMHVGGGGIALARGASNSKVVGCLVTDAAAAGIVNGSAIDCPTRAFDGWSYQGRQCVPDDPDLDCIWGKPGYAPRDNDITDNYVHDIGLVFYTSMGIKTMGIFNPHVAYNYVHHVQYMGIDMCDFNGDSVKSCYAKYNHVASNDLMFTGGECRLCDAAASIYNANNPGMDISHNYLEKANCTEAIRFDNHSNANGSTVTDNVLSGFARGDQMFPAGTTNITDPTADQKALAEQSTGPREPYRTDLLTNFEEPAVSADNAEIMGVKHAAGAAARVGQSGPVTFYQVNGRRVLVLPTGSPRPALHRSLRPGIYIEQGGDRTFVRRAVAK